jgi:hypothetical protein
MSKDRPKIARSYEFPASGSRAVTAAINLLAIEKRVARTVYLPAASGRLSSI